jgi:hypothetical protein
MGKEEKVNLFFPRSPVKLKLTREINYNPDFL